MTEHVAPQAFPTCEPKAVGLLRAGLTEQLEQSFPDAANHVLSRVAEVPHYGDDTAYIAYALAVGKAALEEVLLPVIAEKEAELEVLRAKNAELEANIEKSMREFEQFRRMKTPKAIQ